MNTAVCAKNLVKYVNTHYEKILDFMNVKVGNNYGYQ